MKYRPDRYAPATIQTVSAATLVRHFGYWREQAARAPVYIHHRGRPRLVLTSVELMTALCAPHDDGDAGADAAAGERALLDALATPVLILDRDLRIVALGSAARGFFGSNAVEGASITAVLPAATAEFAVAAIARVLASGAAESLEFATGPRERPGEFRIVPHPTGVIIVGRDRGVEDERAVVVADLRAFQAAIGASTGVATARIGLRGYLIAPDLALAALTGIAAETLATARFVTLFEIGTRVALGDAIELALTAGRPVTVSGRLLVNRGAPLAVDVALSVVRRGIVPDGVLALIVAGRQG